MIKPFNAEILKRHFLDKNCRFDLPFLLAIDCDRTIVDRKRGGHFVHDDVMSMFKALKENKKFIPVINTGRDSSSYKPLSAVLGGDYTSLFLSGRVLHHDDKIVTLENALLPDELLRKLWEKFSIGSLPFLDVKHEGGNTYFSHTARQSENYFGLYKPSDWFHGLDILHLRDEHEFHQLKIVRVELPITRSQHPELFEALLNKDLRSIQSLSKGLWGGCVENLQLIPVQVHEHYPLLQKDLIFLRVTKLASLVNKGTGIKYLVDHLGLPEANVICFGDSSAESASDSIVKQHLKDSTLFISDEGDEQALAYADFVMENVSNNGVPKALRAITAALA